MNLKENNTFMNETQLIILNENNFIINFACETEYLLTRNDEANEILYITWSVD